MKVFQTGPEFQILASRIIFHCRLQALMRRAQILVYICWEYSKTPHVRPPKIQGKVVLNVGWSFMRGSSPPSLSPPSFSYALLNDNHCMTRLIPCQSQITPHISNVKSGINMENSHHWKYEWAVVWCFSRCENLTKSAMLSWTTTACRA